MSVPRSPGQAAPRTASHSISFYFFIRLIAPVACLTLLWGLVTAAILSGNPHGWHWLRFLRSGTHALAGAVVIGGAGTAVAAVAVVLAVVSARRLMREVDGLAATARSPGGRPRPSVAQLAAVADAVASVHRSAAAAVAAEAALRTGFREILISLGKRNQSLLHRQLRIIDTLEQQATSPAALADLFTLDLLTTRMRRHAESLTILSGAAPGRSWNRPVPIVDVIRGAVSEVEDYTRVTIMSESDEGVAAPVVIDVIHLLAELIENATLFSPSSTRVEVRAERVANGFAVEVEDRGLGIPADQLRELNAQLASPPDFGSADADRIGLFVVGRLAVKHGIHVSLVPSPYRGIKAVVILPESVVIPASQLDTAGKPGTVLADDQFARFNLHAPEVLSLAGAVTAGSPAATPQAGTQPDSRPGSRVKVTGEMPAITLHGLPRRVRPGGQSQGGHDAKPGADASPAARQPPVESPAPEAARSLAASLRSSWQRSRQDDGGPDSGSEADDLLPARRDLLAPDSALDSEG